MLNQDTPSNAFDTSDPLMVRQARQGDLNDSKAITDDDPDFDVMAELEDICYDDLFDELRSDRAVRVSKMEAKVWIFIIGKPYYVYLHRFHLHFRNCGKILPTFCTTIVKSLILKRRAIHYLILGMKCVIKRRKILYLIHHFLRLRCKLILLSLTCRSLEERCLTHICGDIDNLMPEFGKSKLLPF